MAGGATKYRHLSRDSAHRKALLRNLVTALIKDESITTTYHKAKEAQRMADKLITLAKRNNEQSRRAAQGILFTPHLHIDKLFGELRERYAARPGGYTRVLRTEPKDAYSQAESAVLELVDSPKDIRFHMTAATIAHDRELGHRHKDVTKLNIKKLTAFRPDGKAALESLVDKISAWKLKLADEADAPPKEDTFARKLAPVPSLRAKTFRRKVSPTW